AVSVAVVVHAVLPTASIVLTIPALSRLPQPRLVQLHQEHRLQSNLSARKANLTSLAAAVPAPRPKPRMT
ncbi:MAG: hypothetical protein ABSH19_05860, partial [Opitutales bacterium]